jgi:hypothetical protein
MAFHSSRFRFLRDQYFYVIELQGDGTSASLSDPSTVQSPDAVTR